MRSRHSNTADGLGRMAEPNDQNSRLRERDFVTLSGQPSSSLSTATLVLDAWLWGFKHDSPYGSFGEVQNSLGSATPACNWTSYRDIPASSLDTDVEMMLGRYSDPPTPSFSAPKRLKRCWPSDRDTRNNFDWRGEPGKCCHCSRSAKRQRLERSYPAAESSGDLTAGSLQT